MSNQIEKAFIQNFIKDHPEFTAQDCEYFTNLYHLLLSSEKEMQLKIIVGYDSVEMRDDLEIELSASPNIALGFIRRARSDLDKMEKQVIDSLSKKPIERQNHEN